MCDLYAKILALRRPKNYAMKIVSDKATLNYLSYLLLLSFRVIQLGRNF